MNISFQPSNQNIIILIINKLNTKKRLERVGKRWTWLERWSVGMVFWRLLFKKFFFSLGCGVGFNRL